MPTKGNAAHVTEEQQEAVSVPVYHKTSGSTNLLLTILIIWGAAVSILGLSV